MMESLQHGGQRQKLARWLGCREEDMIDFSASLNPQGPPDWLRQCISSRVHSLSWYPDSECHQLIQQLADFHKIQEEQLVAGHGTTQLIHMMPAAFGVSRILLPAPSYSDYAFVASLSKAKTTVMYLKENEHFTLNIQELESGVLSADLVFLGHPHNPTGRALDVSSICQVASLNPHCKFIIDESYIEFNPRIPTFIGCGLSNVLVLRSMTKFFAIPGLRLGYAAGDAGMIQTLKCVQPPWSVCSLAQAVGIEAIKDETYRIKSQRIMRESKEWLTNEITKINGLYVFDGQANFLLVRIDSKIMTASQLFERLLSQRIIIRDCTHINGLSPYYFRISVQEQCHNRLLTEALRQIFNQSPFPVIKKPTPAIMFQGTGSNVGKSILTAALCRILVQDGFNVAPFKAQNMSLNSYVTRNGEEMGRAQVLQAKACRIEPDIRMNPVLLKPSSNATSQVLVKGKVMGTMSFYDYIAGKRSLIEDVRSCYDTLSSQFDVMVIEGAGSAGEVNLKSRDIVNMKMARYAQAKVILAGDIDNGGVFANLIGHMEVLSNWERNLICGFMINRFRCDPETLKDGVAYLEKFTGRPNLGIIPFINRLQLPEEDSVNFDRLYGSQSGAVAGQINVAVIKLPMTSNFTDFDPLMIEDDLNVYLADCPEQVGQPDILFLPGSKNVMSDFDFLVTSGLDSKIEQLALSGKTEIVGICGGFQMLGDDIRDPHRVESEVVESKGLKLLNVSTILNVRKKMTQTHAISLDFNLRLKGYEIHHGETRMNHMKVNFETDSGDALGVSNSSGMVWGTYLHGLFENDLFRQAFLNRVRLRKGYEPSKQLKIYDLEEKLDHLADVVRQNVDLKQIYSLLGL